MDTFGKRLVAAREKLNMTQKDLANLLEITPTRLNYWEKDKREPDVAMIKRLSNVLQVDPNYLIGVWTDDMYEDFQHTHSNEERLSLFNQWGVPQSLSSQYRSLVRNTPSADELTEEEFYFLTLFRQANDTDRKIILLTLSKYENQEGKNSGNLLKQKNTG